MSQETPTAGVMRFTFNVAIERGGKPEDESLTWLVVPLLSGQKVVTCSLLVRFSGSFTAVHLGYTHPPRGNEAGRPQEAPWIFGQPKLTPFLNVD